MLIKRWLLAGFVLSLPIATEVAASVHDLPDDDSQAVRPVEAGAGGIIKPETDDRTDAESRFDLHLHVLGESRYVTEGIDNLSGKHLFSLSSEVAFGDLNIVPWLAHSDAADYTEINLNFIYGIQLTDSLSTYLGYNRIQVRVQDEVVNDDEINLDLLYVGLRHIQLFSTIYHSFLVDGSFIEAAVRSSTDIDERTMIDLVFLVGANAGYIPYGHDGVNHVQLRTNISYSPMYRLELYGYLAYNQSVNRDAERYLDDELLGNFFWAGAGMAYRF